MHQALHTWLPFLIPSCGLLFMGVCMGYAAKDGKPGRVIAGSLFAIMFIVMIVGGAYVLSTGGQLGWHYHLSGE